jgi:hypothetical protein
MNNLKNEYLSIKNNLLNKYDEYRYNPNKLTKILGYTSDSIVWGPALWTIIHYIAENNIVNENNFNIIYNIIVMNIVCKTCRHKLSEYSNFNNYNNDFKLWAWSLHNDVNKILKKEEYDYNQLSITYTNINIIQYFEILLEQFIVHDVNNCLDGEKSYVNNIDILFDFIINNKL